MLSISTIASAIADASISTDPSQLAAMIVELTKRSRARNRPESVGPAVNSTKEPHSAEHVRLTFRFLHLQILLLFGHYQSYVPRSLIKKITYYKNENYILTI